MSFDIFVQHFEAGDVAEVDPLAIRRLLSPYLKDERGSFGRLVLSDGEADLYGLDELASGFMVNRASGSKIWALLIQVAAATSMAIMPMGCPVVVTAEEALNELPPELAGGARVVNSGVELQRIMETS